MIMQGRGRERSFGPLDARVAVHVRGAIEEGCPKQFGPVSINGPGNLKKFSFALPLNIFLHTVDGGPRGQQSLQFRNFYRQRYGVTSLVLSVSFFPCSLPAAFNFTAFPRKSRLWGPGQSNTTRLPLPGSPPEQRLPAPHTADGLPLPIIGLCGGMAAG